MHSSLLLCLWGLCGFILLKLISTIHTELGHRRREKALGCQRPVGQDGGFLGIARVREALAADKAFRVMYWFKEMVDERSARIGRVAGTSYQNLLGSGTIFTIDPKNIQTVLAIQFKDFGLGDVRNKCFEPLLGNGIFATDGQAWEHSRAMLRPQFARDQVSDLDLEERHVQNMFKVLPIRADGWTEVTDLKPLFFHLTMDSATEFLFGQSTDSQISHLPGYTPRQGMKFSGSDFETSFDKAQAALSVSMRFGDMYWLAQGAELKKRCKECHDFIDQYVNLALTKPKSMSSNSGNGSGKHPYVFLDALAEQTRDPLWLRYQLINILLAGRDTTASFLCFIMMVLTMRPDVFSKLRRTIIEEFGTYTKPKNITFSGLKNCSYLQWVLNETLRLYPIVPVDGRAALRDTTLPTGGGPDGTAPVYVRKGQQVDYSVLVMHRRTDLWGPDADEFRPERWDGRRSGWEYLPFNGGPRICIGQQFALTEAGYVVVRMLQRFDVIEGVGNTWEPVEKGGYGYVRAAATLTVSPADGVKVRMRVAQE